MRVALRRALAISLIAALLLPAAARPVAAQGGFNLPYGFIQELSLIHIS